FYLLQIGSMIAVPQRIGYQVLLGTRRVKLLALLFAAEGACNLVISLALVPSYGLIGVALGTLIPTLLFQAFVQPLSVCRCLQISLSTYCRQVLMRPALLMATLAPLFLLARPLFPSTDWASFLFATAAMFSLTSPLVLLIGFTKSERASLLIRPVVAPAKEARTLDQSRFTALQRCDQFVGRTTNWLYDHFRFVQNCRLVVLADA